MTGNFLRMKEVLKSVKKFWLKWYIWGLLSLVKWGMNSVCFYSIRQSNLGIIYHLSTPSRLLLLLLFLLRWYCHFDDDNYVNVNTLYSTLGQFDWSEPWYVGKISVSSKLSSIYNGVILKIYIFMFINLIFRLLYIY